MKTYKKTLKSSFQSSQIHPRGKHLKPKPTSKNAAKDIIKLIVIFLMDYRKRNHYKSLLSNVNFLLLTLQNQKLICYYTTLFLQHTH